MAAISLRTISTKTEFGTNIDVMRHTKYVGNIRVHRGHIVCNPVTDHHINKEVILYEYSWEPEKRLEHKEYIEHINKCKESIQEFVNKRKEIKK